MAAPVFTKVGSFSKACALLLSITLYIYGCNMSFSHQSLQDLLVSEGQLVVLECRVKGVPSPRVDWYREGKMIADSPDFRILQKSRPCCCHIRIADELYFF